MVCQSIQVRDALLYGGQRIGCGCLLRRARLGGRLLRARLGGCLGGHFLGARLNPLLPDPEAVVCFGVERGRTRRRRRRRQSGHDVVSDPPCEEETGKRSDEGTTEGEEALNDSILSSLRGHGTRIQP